MLPLRAAKNLPKKSRGKMSQEETSQDTLAETGG